MKKLIVPMLAVVLAVTSAFTTDFSKNSKKDAAIVKGYLRLDSEGTECEASNDCSTVFNTVNCHVGNIPSGARLWNMNANSECIVPLYKP